MVGSCRSACGFGYFLPCSFGRDCDARCSNGGGRVGCFAQPRHPRCRLEYRAIFCVCFGAGNATGAGPCLSRSARDLVAYLGFLTFRGVSYLGGLWFVAAVSALDCQRTFVDCRLRFAGLSFRC